MQLCIFSHFTLRRLCKALHNRRKFTEALKEDKTGAEYALEQIGMLYRVESMASDQDMDYEQRAGLREKLAYPILCAFEK
jgi:transposase